MLESLVEICYDKKTVEVLFCSVCCLFAFSVFDQKFVTFKESVTHIYQFQPSPRRNGDQIWEKPGISTDVTVLRKPSAVQAELKEKLCQQAEQEG